MRTIFSDDTRRQCAGDSPCLIAGRRTAGSGAAIGRLTERTDDHPDRLFGRHRAVPGRAWRVIYSSLSRNQTAVLSGLESTP
jgi:hypothetical protein